MKRIIGLTGGIGAGKSIVRDVASAMGCPIYDCDSRAKILMDESPEIIRAIRTEICPDAIISGHIDRKILASCIFNDVDLRIRLNEMVHAAVREDILIWTRDYEVSLIESAILYTSGLDRLMTEVWEVTAPDELRISRVILRNPDLSEADIRKRIVSQAAEMSYVRHPHSHVIVNDGVMPVLPQIEVLLS